MPTFAFLQAAQVSAAPPDGKAQKVTVTVTTAGNVADSVARALLSALGLRSDTQVADFNRQAGYDLLRHASAQLRGQRVFTSQIEAARRMGRRELTITVAVALAIVNDVRRFLSLPAVAAGAVPVAGAVKGSGGPGAKPPIPISRMSNAEKLGEAMRRSLPMLPADAREEVEAMLTPQSLAIMAGVLLLWVVSHFFGVGEVADVVLLVVGAVALGGMAVKAGEELYGFASDAINATREEDLDRAAHHFSEAVAMIGVQAVAIILMKRAPKVFRKPFQNRPTVTTSMIESMAPPKTPGRLFYRSRVTADATLRAGEGYTTGFGDVFYSSRGGTDLQKIVRVHERVHSLLTPKLQIMRNIRITAKVNGYNKSFILRYLEEALAETAGQVSVKGLRGVVEGITFPVKNGYVTVAAMGVEAAGVVLGPINVGGMVYRVIYSPTPPAQRGWKEVDAQGGQRR